MAKTAVVEVEKAPESEFLRMLQRSRKEIVGDRAVAIFEETEMMYTRTIQDLKVKVKNLHRKRQNLMDVAPKDRHSLVPTAGDFDAKAFIEEDIELGQEIKETKEVLEILEERYQALFGEK